eukprot:scaffold50027_cov18-Tisochrysis_lutea.AAC.1
MSCTATWRALMSIASSAGESAHTNTCTTGTTRSWKVRMCVRSCWHVYELKADQVCKDRCMGHDLVKYSSFNAFASYPCCNPQDGRMEHNLT